VKARPLFLAALVFLILVGLSGQSQQKGTPSRQQPSRKTQAAEKARKDSLAYADSLHRLARERATADSLRTVAEAQRREDSAKAAFRFRTVRNEAFSVGEYLAFDVNYGPITAGDAILWIPSFDSVAGRQTFRVQFTVNSVGSFAWVYKVEDRYLTFIDVQTLAPWRFEQHLREGNYRRDFIAEFDQRSRRVRTTEGDHDVPEYVHDIMSAFYYTRTLNLSAMKPGERITLHNFYKDSTYVLDVKFLGRQELEVEAGTFRTVVIEPLVKEGGLFKSEGRIVVWLTDDERKIPVRVNTPIVIGSIDAELREYRGLAGPLQSRIR
jgi:hypothetical protein